MNKFVIYILLLLTYLGVSKGFSPSEFGISYIMNQNDLAEAIPGSPVSVVLTDVHSTGFLIKTYYHKYKLIYGFHAVEELIVRTSSQYNEQLKDYLGMSVFRRNNKKSVEDFVPMPPGFIFIGDRSLGYWKNIDSGEKAWFFYRPYRNIPKYLSWGNFRPTSEFYEKGKIFHGQEKPFFGLNNEFGTKGSITIETYSQFYKRKQLNNVNFKKYLLDFFKRNFYTKRDNP